MRIAEAVHALSDAGVDFVIIGGWSAVLHGSSYITSDIDFCFARTRENCKKIADALRPYHPRLRDLPRALPFVWDATTLANGTVVTLDSDLGPVDLLAEVSGIGAYNDVKRHSIRVPAFDREVWTLDLPSLIASKRAAGRAKDLQLLPELESLLEAAGGEQPG
jgi:hypothetical protein